MKHEEELVARFFADTVDQAECLLVVARIRVQEDGVVLEATRRLYVEVRHVAAMELTLGLFHLVPLVIAAMRWMHAAEGFHREKEHQFEGGDAALEGAAFEGGDKTVARGHRQSPASVYPKFVRVGNGPGEG